MKLGFIILAHQNLMRVAELARHLSEQGSPSCIHIDNNTPTVEYNRLVNELSDLNNVSFSSRMTCEWGRFSIVKATLAAAEELLSRSPELTNVYLISGSCLPIRPIRQLRKFLQRNAKTDYIESVSVENNFWVKGGLNEERFTLFFPFSWRNRRWLFDKTVEVQRFLKIKREVPDGLVPHIGSQWWCLTAKTLRKILDDPRRPYFDSYFSRSWIPDESYFQTLARKHAEKIESRSLTFSKFDYMGKPFNFYDDHLDLLPLSDCFMGRKIWAGADLLYDKLLDDKRPNQPMTKANPKEIISLFEGADQTRCEGGEGRFHQGRYPLGQAMRSGVSQNDYTVFVGFKNLYEEFPDWVEQNTKALAYGSVFDRRKVSGTPHDSSFSGNLPAEPTIRDRNAKGYLSNFLWENRGRHQSFLYDFRDNPRVLSTIAYDPKATIVMIRHSWLLLLLNRKTKFEKLLVTARRFNKLEQNLLDRFANTEQGCKVVVLDLETAVKEPTLILSQAVSHIDARSGAHLQVMPKLANLDGLDAMVRKLRNKGLKIRFEHDRKTKEKFPVEKEAFAKPYVVK